MQAWGVQGGKPRSLRPSNTPAFERSVMQSTSFLESRVLQISSWSALRCLGRGRNIKTPWMESSALMALICSISASLVTSSGSTNFWTSTPISSARAVAPRS